MNAKLETKQLKAWFGDQTVLRDISLAIPAGEVTAIIGPSGCGKSTLIRCLNRMHETVPQAGWSGDVLLDGAATQRLDPVLLRRHVGMVFQRPNPFPTMSIFENVVAGLRLCGVRDRRTLDAAALASLRRAALWDEVRTKLDAPGTSLSGGQQQRLCIARALAVEPDVLLMDEPCSALDPIATTRIEELIHELRGRYTIVIVTHNMQQAARVADRTAFLYLGELIEWGPTQTLFTNPKDRRTEEYLTGRFG
ncbi:MAG: phosphate ABC transporter ATP-binding protein [Deltaproteobacteria bacterium]|nr:phosphate ABC transporter ATP-binding protein [Deltaproteobacteria bacterium]